MDIDTMVENHFKKNRDVFGFESIAQLIEEVMDSMEALGIDPELLREAPQVGGGGGGVPENEPFDWNAIPEINISELGWTQMQTPEGGGEEVAGPQRKILEQYLQKIAGGGAGNLTAKLEKLNAFTAEGPSALAGGGSGGASDIGAIMSYLVFYKTLTRVITNFNAASAGFNFESFLAVLLGGQQVPTGSQTIADILVKGGDPEYYSLKLYSEKGVDVGGSWQDLVDDLADPKKQHKMTYLVVLKSLQGQGMDLNGTLTFYEFAVTIQNVANFIAASSKKSRKNMYLPLVKGDDGKDILVTIEDAGQAAPEPEAEAEPELQEEYDPEQALNEALMVYEAETPEGAEQADQKPLGRGRIRVSKEQLEAARVEQLTADLTAAASADENMKEIIDALGGIEALAAHKMFQIGHKRGYNPIFNPDFETGERSEKIKKVLGELGAGKPELVYTTARGQEKNKLTDLGVKTASGKGSGSAVRYLDALIRGAVDKAIVKLRKDPEKARQAGTQQEQVKAAFKEIMSDPAGFQRSVDYYNSLGEDLNAMATALHMSWGYIGPKVGHFSTGKSYLTSQGDAVAALEIGADAIAAMIEKARDKLNSDVYTIFQTLKVLSSSLNTYFASGLQDPQSGEAAMSASKELTEKTEKAVEQTPEEK
jgi:hypothetical protein